MPSPRRRHFTSSGAPDGSSNEPRPVRPVGKPRRSGPRIVQIWKRCPYTGDYERAVVKGLEVQRWKKARRA